MEAVTRQRSSSGGASRVRLAEWERRAYTVLREHAELVTIVDDELPELDYWLARRRSRGEIE